MNPDRPNRPAFRPDSPPPGERGPSSVPLRAALPVGVREGDVIVIGGGHMTDAEESGFVERLRSALGVYVAVVFVPAPTPVTVLRPER